MQNGSARGNDFLSFCKESDRREEGRLCGLRRWLEGQEWDNLKEGGGEKTDTRENRHCGQPRVVSVGRLTLIQKP